MHYKFSHLIFTKALGVTYYFPHFTEEEIETRKGCGYNRVLSEFELRPSNYATCKCTKHIPKPTVQPVDKTGKHLPSSGHLRMRWFICNQRVVMTYKVVKRKTVTLEHMVIYREKKTFYINLLGYFFVCVFFVLFCFVFL